jgi:peptide deformylase
MILPIFTGKENSMLRKKSESVQKVDKRIQKLVKNMKETLEHANGLGLAAPQVGESVRVLLANFQTGSKIGEKYKTVAIINPVIKHFSEDKCWFEEGCLSLPDIYESVERPKDILVEFMDEKGNQRLLELSGINSRIVQHETDHLDGKLFIDYLEPEVVAKHKKKLDEMKVTL